MIELIILKGEDCYVGYVPSMMYVASCAGTRREVMEDLIYQVSVMCELFFENNTMVILKELNIKINESDESRTS